jgi:hypothetical protein
MPLSGKMIINTRMRLWLEYIAVTLDKGILSDDTWRENFFL